MMNNRDELLNTDRQTIKYHILSAHTDDEGGILVEEKNKKKTQK